MSSSLSDLVFTFPIEESIKKWNVRPLTGAVTHPTLGEVASLSGYLIYRSMLCGQFLLLMEKETRELHEFSVTLFDRNGLLRPHFKTGYRSGTGCWGDELNEDALAYVQDITVKEEYRCQGIGSQLLQALRESKHKPYVSNIVCWPSAKDGTAAKDFFIKNGFRRIGRTQFFGYSTDPGHPSHLILASDDVQQSVREAFPQPSYHEMLASGQSPEEISNNIKRERLQKYPLHCAILSDQSGSIAQIIHRARAVNPRFLYAPNDVGFLPMHVAVQRKNMIAFNTLLDLGRVEDLQNNRNANGTTPLEVLRDNMVRGREYVEKLVTASWPGYAEADLSMEYAVKTAMGMYTGCATVEDYIAQNKYGCTCGQCIGGWLSPRMIFQLRVQASSSVEFMHEDEESMFTTRQAIDARIVESLYSGDFIPPSLYVNLCLSFYRGFTAVFRAAYDVLKRVSLFNAETVLSQVRHAYSYETMYFFSKGGKVEYALDAITNCARGQSMVGDRTFYEVFTGDDELVALPMCSNDNEFWLVRRMVGLDPEKKWGRYRWPEVDDDNDDMDVDEDESF